MPICPRCGKTLSSEQALTYHLNRKYRCNTWVCSKCSVVFNTKFDLHIHQLKCSEKTCHEHSSAFLASLVKLPLVLCEYDPSDNKIKYITPRSTELVPGIDVVIQKDKSFVSEKYPWLNKIYDQHGVLCFTEKLIKEVLP